MSKEINTCIHCGDSNEFKFYLYNRETTPSDAGYRREQYMIICVKCGFERLFTNLVPGIKEVGMITTGQLIDFWNQYNNTEEYFKKNIRNLEWEASKLEEEIHRTRMKLWEVERKQNDRVQKR